MSSPQQLNLLSIGVLAIILAALLVVFFPDWGSIFSLTIALYGIWILVLAGIRAKNPVKYARGAYSISMWGILLLVIGGAWFLFIQTSNLIVTIVALLVAIGILAIAAAFMRPRK